MTKCLYFLLFVAASQAFVTKEVQNSQRSIPTPTFTDLNSFFIPVLGFTIEWIPVTSTNANPIIGYRLFVLEETRPGTNEFKNFQDIILHGGDKSIAAVAEIKRGFWYHCRVQAITSNGIGPLSALWGIIVFPLNDGERNAAYTIKLVKNSEDEIF